MGGTQRNRAYPRYEAYGSPQRGIRARNDLDGPKTGFEKYEKEGFIDSKHPEFMQPLPFPAILLAGRRSEVIGADSLAAAANALRVPVRWFENSGHFIYAEEPEAFSKAVVEFLDAKQVRAER